MCCTSNEIGNDQVEKSLWSNICFLEFNSYECSEYHAIDSYKTCLKVSVWTKCLSSDDAYHSKCQWAWNLWWRRGLMEILHGDSFWVYRYGLSDSWSRILVLIVSEIACQWWVLQVVMIKYCLWSGFKLCQWKMKSMTSNQLELHAEQRRVI